MSTYAFEPNPEDYGPEPAHIANSHRAKANPKITIPLMPEPNVEYVSGHREPLVFYDAAQLREYGQQCRAAALEEAAQVCSHKAETKRLYLNESHYLECAEAIRSLK